MRYLILSVLICLMMLFLANKAMSHEMTPAYPELRNSYMPEVKQLNLKLFNRRSDVLYYEISVFDKEWEQIPFASTERIFKVNYLDRKSFTVFIRDRDVNSVGYVCTRSKLLKGGGPTVVSSKICSKVK
jgi:hypothetical protein